MPGLLRCRTRSGWEGYTVIESAEFVSRPWIVHDSRAHVLRPDVEVLVKIIGPPLLTFTSWAWLTHPVQVQVPFPQFAIYSVEECSGHRWSFRATYDCDCYVSVGLLPISSILFRCVRTQTFDGPEMLMLACEP